MHLMRYMKINSSIPGTIRWMEALVVFSVLVVISSCKDAAPPAELNHPFTLRGVIEGQDTGWVSLQYMDSSRKWRTDSVRLDQQRFSFGGYLPHPVLASLFGPVRSNSMDDPNTTQFFIEPGNISFHGKVDNLKDGTISGSATQMEYKSLLSDEQAVEDKYKPQLDSLRHATSPEQIGQIRSRLEPYFEEMKNADLHYFRQHPQSWVTALFLGLYSDEMATDSLTAFYNRLAADQKQSVFGKKLAGEIASRSKGKPGTLAPDFAVENVRGETIRLSAFQGHYVVIDFWASWCIPCRQESPELMKLYKTYADRGFRILAVSDDDSDPDKWKEAIQKDGTGKWEHVLRGYDPNDKYPEDRPDISELFAVNSMPTQILIDPTGKIVGRFDEGGLEDLKKMVLDVYAR